MIILDQKVFSYYRPYKGLFILDFTCAVIAGLLELVFPLAVSKFIDDLFAQPGLAAYPDCLHRPSLHLCAEYRGAIHRDLLGHMLGINIETDLREKMFSHIQKLSFRFFDNNKTGHLMGRITNDLNDVGEVAHHGPEDVFIAVMTLLGSFSLMAYINLELALLTFIIVPFMAWLIIKFGGRMTTTYRQLFRNVGNFNARIEDNVGGIRVVQSFANEEHENKLFQEENKQFRATKLLAYKTMAKACPSAIC